MLPPNPSNPSKSPQPFIYWLLLTSLTQLSLSLLRLQLSSCRKSYILFPKTFMWRNYQKFPKRNYQNFPADSFVAETASSSCKISHLWRKISTGRSTNDLQRIQPKVGFAFNAFFSFTDYSILRSGGALCWAISIKRYRFPFAFLCRSGSPY